MQDLAACSGVVEVSEAVFEVDRVVDMVAAVPDAVAVAFHLVHELPIPVALLVLVVDFELGGLYLMV